MGYMVQYCANKWAQEKISYAHFKRLQHADQAQLRSAEQRLQRPLVQEQPEQEQEQRK
jgi:hypothetical protein